jgi:hypothetical protein
LKLDGSNYMVWRGKIDGAFAYEDLQAVLKPPIDPRFPHTQEDMDAGIFLLQDYVVDELHSVVRPPEGSSDDRSPIGVMARLHARFAGAFPAMISTHRASILRLQQLPGEAAVVYITRAQALLHALQSCTGHMDSADFLSYVKEGVLQEFRTVVRFFEESPQKDSIDVLAARLQAEECVLARIAARHPAGPQNFLNVTIGGTGVQQPWTPRPQAAGGGRGGGRQGGRFGGKSFRDEAAYKATGAKATCFNCGAVGHRVSDCHHPVVTPLRFKPADWQPSSALRRGGRGPGPNTAPAPQPPAQGGMQA